MTSEVTPKNFKQLKSKTARLKDIIEILKNVNCTVKSPLRERLYEAERLYDKYNVHIKKLQYKTPEQKEQEYSLNNAV